MEVEYAFLADHAEAGNGKLTAMGIGFDNIYADSFPAMHPQMTLVVKMKVHPMEADAPHEMSVALLDEDGNKMGEPFSAPFEAPRNKENPGGFSYAQMLLNLKMTRFPKPGRYEFSILVDKQHVKSLQLEVKRGEIPKQPQR